MARNKYRQESYPGTYSCGHEGKERVGGYSDEYRDSEAERRFNGLCPKCKKIQKMEEYKKEAEEAKKEAEEIGLPELEGSEKQINWAVSIRQSWIDEFSEKLELLDEQDILVACEKDCISFVSNEMDEKYAEFKESMKSANGYSEKHSVHYEWIDYIKNNLKEIEVGLIRTFQNMINTVTSSKFYIDNRSMFGRIFNECYGFSVVLKEFIPKCEEEILEEERILQVDMEQTVRPENYVGYDVKLETEDNKIVLYSNKDQSFTDKVKSLGYRWGNRGWYRNIKPHNGTLEDRIAEVGSHLLNMGFSVQFNVDDYITIKKKAIQGEYEAEHERWVFPSKCKKKFEIAWMGYDKELYDKVKSLPKSKYNRETGRIEVDAKFYNDVKDLANLYGFKFTDGANEMIEFIKKERDKDEG